MSSAAVPEWLALQLKIFSRWVSMKLWNAKKMKIGENVVEAIQKDPTVLLSLTEVLSEKPFTGKLEKNTRMRVQIISNANQVLAYIYNTCGVMMKIKTSPEDLVDGDVRNVLGLIFSILLKYMKVGDDEEGSHAVSAKEALLLWVSQQVSPKGLTATDFTKSFHSGLVLCALINKFRPQLLNYDALDKSDKTKCIKAYMDAAEQYFNLPQYITPAEFLKLDESGMLVYVSEAYYGIQQQRKVDQAARRILKVVKFTKQCDKLRAQFAENATKFKESLTKVEKILNDRTVDNTMAGAQHKLEEFYSYKTQDKNKILQSQLALEAAYNQLAILLVNNHRPEFIPPAGLTLPDIEKSMQHLEEVEAERKVALHAELNRQIKLAKLAEHHGTLFSKLEEYCAAKTEYLQKKEEITSIGAAEFAIKTLEATRLSLEDTLKSTVAELKTLGASLVSEKYEHSNVIGEHEQTIDAAFAQMSTLAAAKKPVLDDDLAREKFRAHLIQLAGQHLDRYNKLVAWNTEMEAYLAVREEINNIPEASENIGKLATVQSEISETASTAVKSLLDLGQEILTAKYETEYSSHVFASPDEITGRESDVDGKMKALNAAAEEKKKYLEECLAREEKKEQLRIEFARCATDAERWSADAAGNLKVALFGFTLEEVEAYANELQASEGAIRKTLEEKMSACENVWKEMAAMNFSDNAYTSHNAETIKLFSETVEQALQSRHAKYDKELATQRANDELCKRFAEAADPLVAWINQTKDTITRSKTPLKEQLAYIVERISKVAEETAALEEVKKLQSEIDAAGVTNNRHTLATAKDVQVLVEQFSSFLETKKSMLETEIENEERRGISQEQIKDIEANFALFDKDHNKSISLQEMKSCLYSLGEEMTKDKVAEVMTKYGDGKEINYDGFFKFMVHLFGDTDSKEDVLGGWELIALGEKSVTEKRLTMVCAPEAIEYVKTTAPKTATGWDYAAWTNEVFSRQITHLV